MTTMPRDHLYRTCLYCKQAVTRDWIPVAGRGGRMTGVAHIRCTERDRKRQVVIEMVALAVWWIWLGVLLASLVWAPMIVSLWLLPVGVVLLPPFAKAVLAMIHRWR